MAETLAEYRREAGFRTQKALGDFLGVARPVINKWENGKRTPDISMIKPLAQALKRTEGEIIDVINKNRVKATG